MGDEFPAAAGRSPAAGGSDPGRGLDDRLRDKLAEPSDDPAVTWADRLADSLIAAAAAGDLRSWAILSRRVGAAVPATSWGPTIDDETARRVLEAVRGPVDDRSPD